jgi:endoribonuclease Dicer
VLGKIDSIVVLVHGSTVAGPFIAPSMRVAKGLACESALATLRDSTSDQSLARLCACNNNNNSHG